MNEKLTASILDQFDRAIVMLREAVEGFPVDEWTQGETDYLRPAGVAYHAIESIEFYAGDTPVDKFGWGARFDCDWEDPDSSKLPTQDQIMRYLDDVWANSKEWTQSQDFSQPEPLFKWAGATVLGRLLYLLRHTQHHTAEMCSELTRRGFHCPEWR